MCKWCLIAQKLLGYMYLCRPCWRRKYHNKKG